MKMKMKMKMKMMRKENQEVARNHSREFRDKIQFTINSHFPFKRINKHLLDKMLAIIFYFGFFIIHKKRRIKCIKVVRLL